MSFSSFEFDEHQLLQNCEALLHGETNYIANAANISSLIFHSLPHLNWVGFYFIDMNQTTNELVLGPFQGKPACIRIPIGKGVCGTAVLHKKTMVIDDVHSFEGHIACDSASESELVIPIVVNGFVKGVFDLDSPIKKRFSQEVVTLLEKIVLLYSTASTL
jgi:L-methionine (R)-S-oxide reductase